MTKTQERCDAARERQGKREKMRQQVNKVTEGITNREMREKSER